MKMTVWVERPAKPWAWLAGFALLFHPVAISRGAESESLVRADGDVRYALAFPAPSGVAPLVPELRLVYSSASKAGAYGWGWSLEGLGAIERSTLQGTPAYGALGKCDPRDAVELDGQLLERDAADCKRFRGPSRELASIAYDPESDAWTVTRRDGTRLLYGALDAADPSTHSRLRNEDGQTFRWGLDRIVGGKGRAVRIEYRRATALVGGVEAVTQLYPRRISSESGTERAMLQLDWEERRNDADDPADRPTSFRAGFRIETALRLKRVIAGRDGGDGELIAGASQDRIESQHELAYASKTKSLGGAPYIEPMSRLVEIRRVSGAKGPALMRFAYTEPAREFLPEEKWQYGRPDDGTAFLPRLESEIRLPGKPGCESRPPDGLSCYGCSVDSDSCDNGSGPGCCSAAQSELYRSSMKLLDLNGDGWVDRLRILGSPRRWEVCTGVPGAMRHPTCATWRFGESMTALDTYARMGDGRDPKPNRSIRELYDDSDPGTGGSPTYYGVYADLVDLDGDGRPDRIEDHYDCDPGDQKCPYSPSAVLGNYQNWSFWRNTGSGFAPRQPWKAPRYRTRVGNPYIRSIAFYESNEVSRQIRARSRLLDVNGDRRPDHLIVGLDGAVTVSMNSGTRFETPQPLALDWPAPMKYPDVKTGDGLFDRGFDREFVDVNGDGLPDQIVRGGALGSDGPPKDALEIRFNLGRGFQHGAGRGQLAVDPRLRLTAFGGEIQPLRRVDIPQSQSPAAAIGVTQAFVDFNGDGTLDRLRATDATEATAKLTDGMLDVFYGLGDGSFVSEPERWRIPFFRRVNSVVELAEVAPEGPLNTLIDVNGDGLLDRVRPDTASRYAEMSVFLHPGTRLVLTGVDTKP
jgi:hypothetical protein